MDNILIEPPAVSEFGNQRIMGGFGANKAHFAWPPFDIMMISGCLEHHGFPASIYDFCNTKMTFEDVRKTIIAEKPKMIVFSTSSTTIYSDLKIADIAKEISKDILTVAISVHVMGLKEEVLSYNENLDVAIYNEPELVVLNLVRNNYNPENVLGICYRRGSKITTNPPQPNIKNLEDLGFPSHDKIPMNIYQEAIGKRRPFTIVMAQRGCVGNCTFCCQPTFWGEFRQRSVPNVIEELKWIKKLGYREVFFNDSRLTVDARWANQLTDQMIANKIDLTWSCTDHATSGLIRDRELLKKMKKAGCHQIRMGLESANLGILKNIKKGVAPEQIRKAAAMIKKEGMKIVLFLLLGLPGETKETMQETIKFAKSINIDYVTLGIAQPFVGTPFYKYLTDNGYLRTREWNKYDPTELPVYDYPNLSAQEILDAHRNGLLSFYLRPSYILKQILQIRSLSDIRNNFNGFLGFFTRYILPNKKSK